MATLTRQSWLFAVGSAFFAVATLPGLPAVLGAGLCNGLTFVGSWFFTTAGWMQLTMSRRTMRLEWLSALIQFAGTLMFNLSTGAAVWAHQVQAERHLVWTPDAAGSTAFLISGLLALLAAPGGKVARLNMIGCIAFGVSAVGAFVRRTGATEDEYLANLGTFIGALCFLVAALLALPRRRT